MSKIDLKIPNIGDFKNVEVIEILISEGQTIKKNEPMITIESDKSSVEIPSTEEGKILKVNIKVGDKVSEGDKILELETVTVKDKEDKKTKIDKKEIVQEININDNDNDNDYEEKQGFKATDGLRSLASPKARKFARELGLNINQISGTERQGRVTESDIKKFVLSKKNTTEIKGQKYEKELTQPYSHSEFGEIIIKDIPRVKKLASTYLMNSWTKIPHVTNHDEADITELEEFRTSLKDIYTGEKKKITPLAFIVKALTTSLKKFPNFNSSLDKIEDGKMTIKKYYHIGIAVDTSHGLMVPKLRNVDNKNISLIGKELKQLSEKCKNLKIDKKELFGGSMTITSLGGIGGSFFTPIINYPEVAILGVGKSEKKQIYIDGKYNTRTMLPLSLSYDHRIIDGAEAARFNNDLKENLGKNFAYKLAV
jgi:pyruvate dehydrogenase E2 component (dihydrolipoamide acetyltransferase)